MAFKIPVRESIKASSGILAPTAGPLPGLRCRETEASEQEQQHCPGNPGGIHIDGNECERESARRRQERLLAEGGDPENPQLSTGAEAEKRRE